MHMYVHVCISTYSYSMRGDASECLSSLYNFLLHLHNIRGVWRQVLGFTEAQDADAPKVDSLRLLS